VPLESSPESGRKRLVGAGLASLPPFSSPNTLKDHEDAPFTMPLPPGLTRVSNIAVAVFQIIINKFNSLFRHPEIFVEFCCFEPTS